jgi:hypothetical protein
MVGIGPASDTTGDDNMATTPAGPVTLGEPMGVDAMVSGSSVTVTWTDASNAASHVIVLVNTVTEEMVGGEMTGTGDPGVTFNNVPSGTYLALVIAIAQSGAEPGYTYATAIAVVQ